MAHHDEPLGPHPFWSNRSEKRPFVLSLEVLVDPPSPVYPTRPYTGFLAFGTVVPVSRRFLSTCSVRDKLRFPVVSESDTVRATGGREVSTCPVSDVLPVPLPLRTYLVLKTVEGYLLFIY